MRRTASVPSILGSLVLILAACSSAGQGSPTRPRRPRRRPRRRPSSAPPVATPAPTPRQYVANAADFVAAADWDTKETITIELAEMSFTPKDIVLEAGQPYVLEIVNKGTEKHEFTAEAFMRTVATRKAETGRVRGEGAVLHGDRGLRGQDGRTLPHPADPGRRTTLVCEIEGHFEHGMFGTITVTGQTPASPALELAEVDAGPWVTDGADQVAAADWDTKKTITIDLAEMSFTPKDTILTVGQPYVLRSSTRAPRSTSSRPRTSSRRSPSARPRTPRVSSRRPPRSRWRCSRASRSRCS